MWSHLKLKWQRISFHTYTKEGFNALHEVRRLSDSYINKVKCVPLGLLYSAGEMTITEFTNILGKGIKQVLK